MIRQVVSKKAMDSDFTSDWIKSTMTDIGGGNKAGIGYIQIIWHNVSLNPDSVIRIEVTNDMLYKSNAGSYNVSNTDNTDDALMIAVLPGFKFIRFVYTANSVTSGFLSIVINYE